MMLAKSNTISSSGAVSIDAAFLATAYVGPGQADGPYPDMYEHWQGRHLYESCELPARPEQVASVAESKP